MGSAQHTNLCVSYEMVTGECKCMEALKFDCFPHHIVIKWWGQYDSHDGPDYYGYLKTTPSKQLLQPIGYDRKLEVILCSSIMASDQNLLQTLSSSFFSSASSSPYVLLFDYPNDNCQENKGERVGTRHASNNTSKNLHIPFLCDLMLQTHPPALHINQQKT